MKKALVLILFFLSQSQSIHAFILYNELPDPVDSSVVLRKLSARGSRYTKYVGKFWMDRRTKHENPKDRINEGIEITLESSTSILLNAYYKFDPQQEYLYRALIASDYMQAVAKISKYTAQFDSAALGYTKEELNSDDFIIRIRMDKSQGALVFVVEKPKAEEKKINSRITT